MLRFASHKAFLAFSLLISLSGCFGTDSAYFRSIEYVFSSPKAATISDVLKKSGYLKVTLKGDTQVFLVLGYVLERQGLVEEVWYSGTGEAVHMVNGHVVKTVGLPVDWRSAEYSYLPYWAKFVESVLNNGKHAGMTATVTLNVMPGYLYGQKQNYLITRDVPRDHSSLKQAISSQISWFALQPHGIDLLKLGKHYFGIDRSRPDRVVVFSRQCLSENLCLDFERVHPKPEV